ncbi:MAG: excinuclease ABC subunit A [Bacteroidia bacterium]|nr:MAG: excinuclease ABC subunit A [Bacteroidia bacterium]
MAAKDIIVIGAREHNLKNIDVRIPRNRLTVITGLSGSGKSSLAFDTIYAEGQRRYIETFSAYARQFLGSPQRPDVDKISGLSPVISIEQKTTNKNPRSTVGTITEIYDFLRLLFARASTACSIHTGEPMIKYTEKEIFDLIFSSYENQKILVLSPVVKSRKGHYRELFVNIRRKGFLQVRIDGRVQEITSELQLDRYKMHDIEIVVDKLTVNSSNKERLKASLKTALKQGKNTVLIQVRDSEEVRYFSKNLMCPATGMAYADPAPHTFSFNSPRGACPHCKGLGKIPVPDLNKIIPDPEISIAQGGIKPLGEQTAKSDFVFRQIKSILHTFSLGLKTPVKDIPEEALHLILHSSGLPVKIKQSDMELPTKYDGVFPLLEEYLKIHSDSGRKIISRYYSYESCPECKGARLKKEALGFQFAGKNIAELTAMSIADLYLFLQNPKVQLSKRQSVVAEEILKELLIRLQFLLDVGLPYLSLNRTATGLSGGESQRIRLASQIGSKLVNVLYVLDEPSIGLHQRDNQKLIDSLKKLRDTGNSVIVVEHDKDMMLAADYLIDMGPRAGKYGGKICAAGSPREVMQQNTLTASYLNGSNQIPIPEKRRPGSGQAIRLLGAKGNNLKNLTVSFPLGKLICVTGVSGSGKSTLITETLHPVIAKHLYRSGKKPMPYDSVEGLDFIDKIIEVNQSPIGRTPRSNPATYTKVFDEIRKLYTGLPEAKIRGYKPGRFSFNVKGGRCETCKGAGLRTIEMNFLPDVYVACEDCQGKRYNRETLEIRYKGKSINDILEMTIDAAYDFFEQIPKIRKILQALRDVGLGYVSVGQSSVTLSGGESQRIKLAAELAKRDTGKTFYILDEPTTGLHFEDIKMLLDVLNKLVDKGNTVLIIEHNIDVIKLADHIIDLGKEGGKLGGTILCEGTPEQVARCKDSYTGFFLKKELQK